MPVYVIDTLKPKNGLDFPVVEAVDVAVEGYTSLADAVTHFATEIIINNLQAQIDQIAQTAGTGTADTEIGQARVGADGTSYTTLKARLDSNETKSDSDASYIRNNIFNADNLLLNATIVNGSYYTTGRAYSNSDLSYAIIPMQSSKTYIISSARFIAYETGDAVAERTVDGYEFTPSSDADVYISFYNDTTSHSEWNVYEKGKDATKIGTYQHPSLAEAVLADGTGDNSGIAVSQKAFTDEIRKNIEPSKITGITIKDGTDLSPNIIESGEGGYYYASQSSKIVYYESSDFMFFKLPISGANKYFLDYPIRWYIVQDSSGNVLQYDSGQSDIEIINVTSDDAVLLWVSYSLVTYDTVRKIAIGRTPTDTVFLMPEDLVPSNQADVDKLIQIMNTTNIFDSCEVHEGQYYWTEHFYNNDELNAFVFPVEAGKSYQFGCPLRFLSSDTEDIAERLPAKYIYSPLVDGYCIVSIYTRYVEDCKAVELPNDIDVVNGRGLFSFNPDLIAQDAGDSETLLMSQRAVTRLVGISEKIYGKGYAQATGDLSSGNSLTLPKTNVKKNNSYSFMGYITSFSKLLVGHGKSHYEDSWLEITDTKLIVHNYLNSDSTTEYEHGLTISDYIYVQIFAAVNTAKIVLYSNGTLYTVSDASWYGDGTGDTFAESNGSVLTNCVLTWSSSDFRKSVWMFGDSYFGMTNPARWVKYLIDAGYGDNVLLNSYAGENTTAAITAINNMIQYYGKPNFIIWCLGMNDGSDTDEDTPSTSWMNGVNRILDICASYSITPIFATIPTVPNIYHEGKNKYVRNSEYRYIDFAKAVGASGDGSWFDGMLNADNVHPNVAGAIALYHRAIADCPEITFSNP